MQQIQEPPTEAKKQIQKFPVARVKKIIQENQEIGKINNVVPHLLSSKSLELFLTDVLQQTVRLCKSNNLNKVTPQLLKQTILKSSYDFMKDAVEELPDYDDNKPNSKTKATRKKKVNSPQVDKLSKKIKKSKKEVVISSEDEEEEDSN